MKKIFLFCVLSVLSLTSCGKLEEYNKRSVEANSIEHVKIATMTGFGPVSYLMDISKFNYNGHSYIMFDGNESMNGIIHDPDCSCHNNE